MTAEWHGGKGSQRRKTSDAKKYSEGWDKIFGNKQNKDKDNEQSKSK